MIFFPTQFSPVYPRGPKVIFVKTPVLALQSCLNLNKKKGSCIRGLTQDPFSFLFLLKQPCCSLICLPQIRPVRIRHRSHDFATQCSHFVDIAGWLAEMAPIELWIQWRNAHSPYSCRKIFDSHHREVVEEIECCLSPGIEILLLWVRTHCWLTCKLLGPFTYCSKNELNFSSLNAKTDVRRQNAFEL